MGICPPPQAVPDDSASRKAAIHREVAVQGVAPEDVQKPRCDPTVRTLDTTVEQDRAFEMLWRGYCHARLV